MWKRLAALLAALILLAENMATWWPFLADDALISLRYSERLLDGHGLTWTDGERVEGYSNFLWVILCAALGAVGMDLIVASRVLGILAAVGCVVLVARTLWRGPAVGVLVGSAVTAMSAPLAGWSISGLETSLNAMFILAAVVLLAPAVDRKENSIAAVIPAALVLCLACWTRPDAPVMVATLVAGWWLANGQNLRAARSAIVLAFIPAVATLLHMGFRWLYYGDFVPNTAHAKVHTVDGIRVESGIHYVLTWVDASSVVLILALVGFWFSSVGTNNLRRLVVPMLPIWAGFIVSLGGDFFPGWRYLVVLGPVVGLLCGSGVGGVLERWPKLSPVILVALIPLGLLWSAEQRDAPLMAQVKYEKWVPEQQSLGETLAAAFAPERPLVATAHAGGVPYWSKLPSIDILGLNDAHISRTSSAGGMIGHEVGDAAYVLGRKPDLILFCGSRGGDSPCIGQERLLLNEPGFREHYRMIELQLDAFVTAPWVRIDSEALGFQWSEDTVILPGWFIAHDARHQAQPRSDGSLALMLTGTAELAIPLSSEEWEVVEPSFGTLAGSVLTLTPSTASFVEKVVLRRLSPEL